ncbi:MAG: hypothetical protein JWO75_3899 [Actinomycetia bacterium]|jgi:hypothetical protein|nr:hypothetical protein [Actinomycetes bacterium]
MAENITYFAMIDELTSRDNPRTVLRRVRNDEGTIDEIFSRHLSWEFSPLMYSAERGDLANDFVPISEEEAERIVARIRETGSAAD